MTLEESIEILEEIKPDCSEQIQDAIDKVIRRAKALDQTPDLEKISKSADEYARKYPGQEDIRREAFLAGGKKQMERGVRIHDVVREMSDIKSFRDVSFLIAEMDDDEICEKLGLEDGDRVIIQVYPKE